MSAIDYAGCAVTFADDALDVTAASPLRNCESGDRCEAEARWTFTSRKNGDSFHLCTECADASRQFATMELGGVWTWPTA